MNLKKLFLMLTFMVLFGTTAFAQVYVSTTGNDNNDGSSGSPKKTIQAGINLATAGQTVYIAQGFYDETPTLNKRVNLAYLAGGTQPVSVTGLTLAAGDDGLTNTNNTGDATRASIFTAGTDKLNVLGTLTVTSGYYLINATSNLQMADATTIEWKARTPQGVVDGRFTSDGDTEVRLVALGTYNLTFSNTSSLDGTSSSNFLTQVPAAGIKNLLFSNTSTLTLPNETALNSPSGTVTFSGSGAVSLGMDLTSAKALTVNSGTGTITITTGKKLVAGNNLTNNGRIDGPGTIEMSGAAILGVNRQLAGSGTFNAAVTVKTNSQDLGSAVTLVGALTVDNVDLYLNDFNLTLNGNLTYANAGSVTSGTSAGALIFTGDVNQTIDLGGANRSIAAVTVNKGPASFLYLTQDNTGHRTLTVSDNFNFQAGRINLKATLNPYNAILSFTNAATFRGILTRDATSTATLVVDNTSTTTATTIAGNGQIYIPVTKTSAGEVIFSELTTIGDITVSAGKLTLGQAINVGALNVAAGATLVFSNGSTGSGAITNAGTLTFSKASSMGAVTNNGVGTTTIAAGSTITGAVSVVNTTGAGTGSIIFKGGTVDGSISVSATLAGGTAAFSFQSTATGGLRSTVLTGGASLVGGLGTETITIGGNDADNNHSVEVRGTIGAAALTIQNYAGLAVTKAFNITSIASGLTAAGVKLTLAGSSNYLFTIGGATTIENVEFTNTGRTELSSGNLTVSKTLRLTNGLVAGNVADRFLNIADNAKVYMTGGRVAAIGESTSYFGATLKDDTSPVGITMYYQNPAAYTTGGEFTSNIVYATVRVEGAGKVTLGTGVAPTVNKIVVASGSELATAGNDLTVNGVTSTTPIDVSGSITGTGKVLYTSAGTETIAGSGSIAKATLTVAGGTTVTVSGTIAFGATTAPVAGTLNLTGAATFASLTASGAGTINFGAAGPASITGDASFTTTAININKSLTIGGKFTHTAGTITLGVGNFSLAVQGSPVTLGAPNNYVFNGTGRFILNGSAAQTLTLTSDVIINNVEINNAAGVTQTGGYVFYTSDLLLTSGVYNNGGFLNASSSAPKRITVVGGSLLGTFTAGTEATDVVYQNTADITAGTELSGSVVNLTVASAAGKTVTLSAAGKVTGLFLAQSGTLAAGSNLTMGANSNITIAGGAITGTLVYPTGTSTGVNIRYFNTDDVATGAEMNVTGKINNLTLDGTSGKLVTLSNNALLYGNLTINSGTLALVDKTLEIQGNVVAGTITNTTGGFKFSGTVNKTVDGSYVSLPAIEVAKTKSTGGVFGKLTITRAASTTTPVSASVVINGAFTQSSGDADFAVTNIDDYTIKGNFTIAAGARQFASNANNVYVSGNYSAAPAALNTGETAANGVAPAVLNTGKFFFNGTTAQTISHAQGNGLLAGGTAPNLINFDFNNFEVNNAAGVVFGSNVFVAGTATLRTGVVTTGAYTFELDGNTAASLVRIGGMVNGTFKRAVAATTAGVWDFPVTEGTKLRQLSATMTATSFGAATYITVNHNNSATTGVVGIPIKQGNPATEIVNFIAPMNWVVKIDDAPSTGQDPRFSVYAQGLNFSDIAAIRLISRAGLDEVSNPWTLAGTYVSSLYGGGVPMVIHDGVSGWSIVKTQQFAIGFVSTFKVANALTAQTLVLGGTAYTKDVTTVFSGSQGTLTYSVTTSDATKATAAVTSAGVLTVTAVAEGTSTITVTATDINGETKSSSFVATVQAKPAFTLPTAATFEVYEAATTANTVVFAASGTAGITYAMVPNTPALTWAAFDAATATLTLTPTYGVSTAVTGGVYTITIRATATNGQTTDFVLTVTVKTTLRAPAWTGTGTATIATKSIKYNEVFNFSYIAVDPDGTALTYSLASVTPATTAAVLTNNTGLGGFGQLVFTPTAADAGITYTIVVNATNANGKSSTTTTVLTVGINTPPVFTKALKDSTVKVHNVAVPVVFQYAANDVDGDQFTYTLVSGKGSISATGLYTWTPVAADKGTTNTVKVRITDINNPLIYTETSAVLTVENVITSVESIDGVPTTFALAQNYPNPFNPSTTIQFSIPKSSNVKITVFNILGEEISTLVNSFMNAGNYKVTFNASNLPSGMYLYRIQSENFTQVKKMLLTK